MSSLRALRVGDRVPAPALGPMPARRLDAVALLLPGSGDLSSYRARLEAARNDFATWDGRVRVADPDGERLHRLLIVDRYRQVYAVDESADAADLPRVTDLSEWFRFLATACPECGVLDDPLLTGPTP
jgi:hypothetical protein